MIDLPSIRSINSLPLAQRIFGFLKVARPVAASGETGRATNSLI